MSPIGALTTRITGSSASRSSVDSLIFPNMPPASATPTIPAQSAAGVPQNVPEAQAALRANKEVFFFRLEREIEKVNAFYLQKEAEFSLRLKTLVDKKRVIQSRAVTSSKAPANFVALFEGFQQFDGDLNKLQSRMKELYLHRAVEVQPCFNRDVLRDLSDRATTARLELEAWAEGENIHFDTARPVDRAMAVQAFGTDEEDLDLQILQSAMAGNLQTLREWTAKLQSSPDAQARATRTFLAAINEFSDDVLAVLLESGLVNLLAEDDINERNCLHEAAISGREFVFKAGLEAGVDVSRTDVYGRIPLHYACMHGRVDMVRDLLAAGPHTVDVMDHDNFTPLIHSIVKDQLACAEQLLHNNARIDPASESDHIPLNLACQHGSLSIVQMLLQRRARLLPDAEGLYPQHMVARASQSPQLLLLLKQYGADMNQRDKLYQWTPLFHAASEGCVGCLRTLLELGVDASAVDEKGLSAMYYAAWEGHLECMLLLWSIRTDSRPARTPFDIMNGMRQPEASHNIDLQISDATETGDMETADGIPDLSLPPPIIPLRRYGHNFLDKKVFVQILFDTGASGSICFDQAGRHPAARLTISSKLSDLIPRTIMLPIQEDSRMISFHVDNLESFAVDFEIFPTFGSKVIAKTVALPTVFRAENSSTGTCTLPLFDPRLRSIGQLQFGFQVIKPYHGDPLEITHFATYWKATSAIDPEHNGLVTGSSLSGDHVQLFVQLTKDRVPVLYPHFTIGHHNIEIPICHLTYAQFQAMGAERGINHSEMLQFLQTRAVEDLTQAHRLLASSFLSLRDVFHHLPLSASINLSILYPSAAEERALNMTSLADVNTFADAILTEVFDHARISRDQNPDYMRSVVFTSYNPNICIALNWNQPNCELYMPFQNVVPALVETIKELGLVLVADTSDDSEQPDQLDAMQVASPLGVAEWAYRMPDGVNGVMKANGILKFNDMIDM
ncbi:ankyrin repeat protein nuc-2 [Aspergillus luchuensis]|uniref:Ankyrin repeat protein nuc-2 n=1 Tax=Aspergillus kawachii TaxID=1069201 RepID=A0A146FJ19_ASPKA|nr:ankyrin repeat protein nuc-2 [Aspergillus luchuensis]